jgi:glycosyltransferase involved in cell wall biosynthesis
LRDDLIARLKLDPAQVVSIPTGIDTEAFRPPTPRERKAARHAIGVTDDTFVTGIVATLRSWKGHRFLIEGFAEAEKRRAGAAPKETADAGRIRLLIVGDGPQRDALEALVDTLGVRAHVKFAGNQPNVIPWLHAMDLFVLPSYANEGVPQAILQAMGCGVPVVTTDAGAIGEVAFTADASGDESKATAVRVRKENAADLCDAICSLEADPERRERLAASALVVVRARHGLDGMLDRMEALFRTASGTGVPPPRPA